MLAASQIFEGSSLHLSPSLPLYSQHFTSQTFIPQGPRYAGGAGCGLRRQGTNVQLRGENKASLTGECGPQPSLWRTRKHTTRSINTDIVLKVIEIHITYESLVSDLSFLIIFSYPTKDSQFSDEEIETRRTYSDWKGRIQTQICSISETSPKDPSNIKCLR